MSEINRSEALLDVPSPEVTESQARSFCVRALRGAANRLGGDLWDEVDVNWAVDDGTYPDFAFHFRAMREDFDEDDDELLPETYAVELMHREPVFTIPEQVNAYMVMDGDEPDEDQIFDEPFDTGDTYEEPQEVGHILITETIFFAIFKSGSGCDMSKGLRYDFYSADEKQITSELGYRTEMLLDSVPEDDLENLVRFGEKLLDTQKCEREQSVVTVSDLETILSSLKRGGLAGKRMRAILERN